MLSNIPPTPQGQLGRTSSKVSSLYVDNRRLQSSLSRVLIVNNELLARAYRVKVPEILPSAPQTQENLGERHAESRVRGAGPKTVPTFSRIKARARTAPCGGATGARGKGGA